MQDSLHYHSTNYNPLPHYYTDELLINFTHNNPLNPNTTGIRPQTTEIPCQQYCRIKKQEPQSPILEPMVNFTWGMEVHVSNKKVTKTTRPRETRRVGMKFNI
jgi:hypothetical protein